MEYRSIRFGMHPSFNTNFAYRTQWEGFVKSVLSSLYMSTFRSEVITIYPLAEIASFMRDVIRNICGEYVFSIVSF